MFSFKKLLISSAVLVIVLSLCASLAFAADNKEGTVSGNRVNIRETASTDAKVLTTLEKGTKVSVVSESGDWTKVKYSSYTGWIYSDFLTVKEAAKKVAATSGTVTVETLNVRSKADLDASVVTKLKEGAKVTIQDQSGDWYKIKTSGGEVGWVYAEYISTKNTSVSRGTTTSRGGEVNRVIDTEDIPDPNDSQNDTTTGKEIVAYAKNFIGIKYVYGGETPKQGFDCSGFVKYVYAHFGLSLERASTDQASQGKKVSKANLRIGDLVFFDTNGGKNRINHVGIYVGDGKFIHASSPRYDVTITSLSDDYYARSYMTARRVIN